jgi:hypothetical protein
VIEKPVMLQALRGGRYRDAAEVRTPLSVIKWGSLNPAQRVTFQRLQAFDLSPIRARILKEETIPPQLVDEAIHEFRRYVGFYIHFGAQRSFTMFSEDVDEVWHVCILHTRLYEDFCTTVLGTYLHHQPFLSGDPNARENREYFEKSYTNLYGPIPTFWHLRRLPPPWGPGWLKAIQMRLNPTRRVLRTKRDVNGGCGCGGCGGCGCGGCRGCA